METDSTSTVTTLEHAHPWLADLRRRVAGRVYGPGDPDWDRVRTPWALAVDQTPLAVVEVVDADDVRRAVGWAVDNGRQVTAQPVGHGANDALDGVLLLRTRALNSIDIDPAAGSVTVGAGVKVGELLAALEGPGLAFLAGSNPDPTVVGMTISGGMSWFGRAFGLAANSITAVELVDGSGRFRRVTSTRDPELFWALRGGGGDFGIVTSLEIRLVPGPTLYGGRLLWPVAQMPAVLRAFRQVTASAPDKLTLWYQTLQFPPLPGVPEPFRGKAFAAVALTYLGPAEEAERMLGPLRDVPGILMDLVRPVPMAELGSVTQEPTHPMPTLEHSMLLDDLDDEMIDRLTDVAGEGSGSPLMMLQIRHLGGAFQRPAPGHGAADPIAEPYVLFAMGVLRAPVIAAALNATFGRLDQATAGHSNGRTVPNFLGPGGDLNRVWSPETRRRLIQIKRVVDPTSTIRSNLPVLQAS